MNTAIIVESRLHPALELVMCNFERNLPQDWKFLIIHSQSNKELIEKILRKNSLQRHQTILYPEHITHHIYNQMFFEKSFYGQIDTEHFLIFQPDTLLRDNYSKQKINEYLQYDYVGAPWRHTHNVGNGGLSLRKKSKMLEVLKTAKKEKKDYRLQMEDQIFSNFFNLNVDIKKPSFEEAKNFSVETCFSENSLGLHKAWLYMDKDQMSLLHKQYPELKVLINSQ